MNVHFKSMVEFGTTGEAYGYGRVWTELVNEFKKRDDIKLVNDWRKADLQVCWCQPYDDWEYAPWYRREHPVQVIYTTWECTRIPVTWADTINSRSALFTTSKFCRDVFGECGVRVPIHIVGHGINSSKFPFIEREWEKDEFVFIWQGTHPSDRKGMHIVHRAFEELALPNALLVEKWHPIFGRNWTDDRESQNIKQFGIKIQQDKYKALMGKCHVSVNPTRGEGFGLIPFEAAATGMMTIVTPWSGVLDYIEGTNSFWKVKYKISSPGEAFFVLSTSIEIEEWYNAQDARPCLESVKEGMAWAYNNRAQAKELGMAASEHIHSRWPWSKAATEFVTACRRVLDAC